MKKRNNIIFPPDIFRKITITLMKMKLFEQVAKSPCQHEVEMGNHVPTAGVAATMTLLPTYDAQTNNRILVITLYTNFCQTQKFTNL